MVGTTSLGFNLFMGGTMAKGKELESSQRGIAFSTIAAMEVSILILIVGAGSFTNPEGEQGQHTFSISILSGLIEKYIGNIGVFVFALGFVAAALSSMLTVPLGAGLTVQSVFSEIEDQEEDNKQTAGEVKVALINEIELTVKKEEEEEELVDNKQEGEENVEEGSKEPKAGGSEEVEERRVEEVEAGGRRTKELPRWVYWGIISLMVAIATIVISMNGNI